MPCYKIHITGAVFKTGFRYYLKAKAAPLDITGFVYYENDNSVTVIASGNPEDLDKFLDFCKVGNHFFCITKTEIVEIPGVEYSSFDVRDEVHEKAGLNSDKLYSKHK